MARARATSPWTASAQARYVVVVRGAVCSGVGRLWCGWRCVGARACAAFARAVTACARKRNPGGGLAVAVARVV